jgi:DNA replication protein DnaC
MIEGLVRHDTEMRVEKNFVDSHDHSLLKKLNYYYSPDLLVCDEIGYLPLSTQGSNLFFQVISQLCRLTP